MARGKTKKKVAELPGQSDPRAPLDPVALLAAARPLLARLAEDILERAGASTSVTAALHARHDAERAARRTADGFEDWRRRLAGQVAAAWLLSCVFVRTLEDRGLLGQCRLAGPGALDCQRLFFELAPSLTERDYLLTVFRELSRLPAARALFDARHNPVWKLAPSAEACKALLALFRAPDAESPSFRFGQPDTRFLGDLYQDLDDDVRARFALLQTPRFIESFILDSTLDPALARFGLDEATLIDPTCGSGHFLLGAFERLFEQRLRAEPGLDPREAARLALDAVYGADINPYAVAIARFRLTLAVLDRTGYARLADAPELPLHVVVADSLLHNPQHEQVAFAELDGQSARAWSGEEFALEDEAEARALLSRRFAAVVGNPPYITVKDAVLRDRYREMYASAFRTYSLAVPFTERFFQLARESGQVGMITANSFMKREFGRKVIEEFLPTVNLTLVVNTSGAFIPGHGTPTVLLFGTAASPEGADVLVTLAKRGEPTTPDVAEQGLVWRSIADHWGEVGFENEYISVARVARETLKKHPWSLGGGGAAELKELLEERAEKRLGDIATEIGFGAVTREDELYLQGEGALRRAGVPAAQMRALVAGENIRDWAISGELMALWPYDPGSLEAVPEDSSSAVYRALWPYRTGLAGRVAYGQTQLERGLRWFEYSMFFRNRFRTPLSIAFAEVATHNHFVLDRGGKVFKQTAPIIKLPETATEDDHLALLAYLNSSTACFWLKQVMMNKGGSGIGRGIQDEPWEARFAFDGTKLAMLPVPADLRSLTGLGRKLDDLARSRRASGDETEAFRRMVALQEVLDRTVYSLFGLTEPASHAPRLHADVPEMLAPGTRTFEVQLLRARPETQWFVRNGYELPSLEDVPVETSPPDTSWTALMEQPEYKRRWTIRDPNAEGIRARRDALLNSVEARVGTSTGVLTARALRVAATSSLDGSDLDWTDSVAAEAVPFLSALRYSPSGLTKRAAWDRTWALQRREDAGEAVGEIPVPPKYDSSDFAKPSYWQLRGKLDVPKERFISYPGCESDHDGEPLYGWAGWNHLQQMQALANLYQNRKVEEGWPKDRLTPILAGVLELLPWVKQWHNDPSQEFGGLRLGDYFEAFLDTECRELSLTHDDLRTWRPAERKRASRPRAAKVSHQEDPAEQRREDEEPARPRQKRQAKAKAV